MRRISILLLTFTTAVFFTSAVFYGCGDSKQNNNIKFLCLAWQAGSIAVNKDIINEWNKLHPDKYVEYVQGNWTAISDYLITAFETEDAPDVFQYEASMITDFGNRGNLADLRPYLSDSIKEDIFPEAWKSVTLNNGKIIGVPFLFESLIVLYNKDIFSKYNIIPPSPESPWSWKDLSDAAKKMTVDANGDGKPEQWGAALGLKTSANIVLNLSLGCGGRYFYKAADGFKVMLKEPEKLLLTSIHNMLYREKCASPLAASQSGASIIPGFYSGKYAMIIGIGTWARQQLIENAPKDFHWGVLEPLREVNCEQGSNTQTLSIPACSKRKKDAAEFIEFFLSKRNLPKLALSDWMNPTRKSSLELPQFNTDTLGWKTCASIIKNLRMGPWQMVPGFSEWKGRVANVIFQEYFSNRMTLEETAERIEEESDYVLSRNKGR